MLIYSEISILKLIVRINLSEGGGHIEHPFSFLFRRQGYLVNGAGNLLAPLFHLFVDGQ